MKGETHLCIHLPKLWVFLSQNWIRPIPFCRWWCKEVFHLLRDEFQWIYLEEFSQLLKPFSFRYQSKWHHFCGSHSRLYFVCQFQHLHKYPQLIDWRKMDSFPWCLWIEVLNLWQDEIKTFQVEYFSSLQENWVPNTLLYRQLMRWQRAKRNWNLQKDWVDFALKSER